MSGRQWTVLVAACALGAAAAALPAAPAAAAVTTLYVGGAGCSDAGAGTPAQPFCTINKGATVAVAGQTVLVAAGTYPEKVTVAHSGTAGAPIVLRPAGGPVTVSGAADGFVLSGRSYVTISGFTVEDTTSYGISVSSSSNVVISQNTVTDSGSPASGQTAPGIYLNTTTASTVTGNVADDNSGHGIYLTTTSSNNVVSYNEASGNAEGWRRNANGIDVIGPNNTVIGNVLHDNEDSGLQFYPGGDNNLATLNVSYDNGDHGIDDLNVTGGRLIGNTVYHNCTTGINVEGTSGNYTLRDNIAVDNAVYPAYHGISCSRRAGNIGIWDSAPATTTVDSNLVYLSKPGTMYVFGSSYTTLAAMRTATGQEQHGVQADPHFAAAASGDLRLTEGSAAIDAADSGASGEQPADAAGVARQDDAFVANTGIGPRTYDDIGAYEFVSGSAQPPTAVLGVTPTSGNAPLPVTANGTGSTDPQGQALSYRFDFGDGTVVGPQPGATATHTYATAGTYTVTLTVTDTGGLSGTATATVVAGGAAQPPTAVLGVTPTSGTAPLPVTANGTGSTDPQGQALSYRFDFGDGTVVGPQPGATATHTYATAGTYTVTLTVTDTGGLSGTATATVVATTGGGGGGNPVFVNQIATNYSTSPHTSGYITVWRPEGVAAGDLEVLTVALTGVAPTGAVTGQDDAGNTLAVARDIADGAGNRLVVLYGVAHVALAPNARVTITFPSAATYRITGDEVSGVGTPDVTAAAAGTGTAYASGPTPTTTFAREFVFGAVAVFGGATPAWNAGWTAESAYAVGANQLGRAYRITTATGSFNASGTASGSWLSLCVTFS